MSLPPSAVSFMNAQVNLAEWIAGSFSAPLSGTRDTEPEENHEPDR